MPARIILKGIADAGGKAVTLVITVAAARTLGSDAFGVMALAMTTGWLLGVATDAGLSMYLARETARHRETARTVASGFSRTGGGHRALVSEVMGLRAATAYTAATIVALFSSQFVPPLWRLAFMLVVLAQLTSAVLETLAHFFRGLERSEIESALHLSQRALTLVLAMTVLWWWPRLDYLGVAMVVPPSIALIVGGAIAWRISEPSTPIRLKPDSTLTLRRFISDVLPLGAGVLLSALYFRIDLFFIEQWHGLEPVGAYNAAFRLVEALRLLPAAVMAVTFPLLVQTADTRLVQRIGSWLAAGGALLAVICVAASPAIVTTAYGEPYRYAASSFSVLSLALPLFFLNYALTHQVIGWDGQRAYLRIAALALVANVAANVALVPSQGMVGAAIATVITELVVTAGCLHALMARRDKPVGLSMAAGVD